MIIFTDKQVSKSVAQVAQSLNVVALLIKIKKKINQSKVIANIILVEVITI